MRVRKSTSGKYTITVDIPKGYPRTVKGRTYSETFNSRREGERWARRTEDEISQGRWEDPRLKSSPKGVGVPVLSEAIAEYLKDVTPQRRGSKQETTLLNRLGRSELAEFRMDGITPTMIAEYVIERQDQGRASQTVLNEVNKLSAVFGYQIYTKGVEIQNPVEIWRKQKGRQVGGPPGKDAPRTRRLVENEEEALLRALKIVGSDGAEELGFGNFQMPAIFIIALTTGCRLGEILSLRMTWRYKDVLSLPETKNGYEREVVLNDWALIELQKVEDIRRRMAFEYGEPKKVYQDKYFTLSYNLFHWRWKQAKELAGVRNLRFHDLRHEALSRMVESGADLKVMMLQSGHRSVGQLMRYLNPTKDDIRRMYDRMEEYQQVQATERERQLKTGSRVL